MRQTINKIVSLIVTLAIVLGPQGPQSYNNWNQSQSNVIVQPQNQAYYQSEINLNDKPVTNTQYELPTKANTDAQADLSRVRHNSTSKGTIYTVTPSYDNVTGPGVFINQ